MLIKIIKVQIIFVLFLSNAFSNDFFRIHGDDISIKKRSYSERLIIRNEWQEKIYVYAAVLNANDSKERKLIILSGEESLENKRERIKRFKKETPGSLFSVSPGKKIKRTIHLYKANICQALMMGYWISPDLSCDVSLKKLGKVNIIFFVSIHKFKLFTVDLDKLDFPDSVSYNYEIK